MTNNIHGYGPHLTLDLYDCQSPSLGDVDFVYHLLHDLPEEIGMKKIREPIVSYSNGAKSGDEGVTGIVLIVESHISIHTYEKKNIVFMDIFSCRYFDHHQVEKKLVDVLQSQRYESQCVIRGRHFE